MTRSIVFFAIAAAIATPTVCAQDLSSSQGLGTGFVAAQKSAVVKADEATARQFARDTPQYSAAFRDALKRSLPAAMQASPQATHELGTYLSQLPKPQLVQASNTRSEAAWVRNPMVEIFGGTPVPDTGGGAPTPSSYDFDSRYHTNIAALTSGSDGRGGRVFYGLPSSGYLNTVAVVSGGSICTGTVVARNAVVTAQHCYCGVAGQTNNYVGQVFVGSLYNANLPTYTVVSGTPMKQCTASVSSEADIAVLIVDRDFAANVTPAVLASKATIDQSKVMRAVGFGLTQTGALGQKMMVDIPVVSPGCTGSVSAPGGTQPDTAYYGCNAGFELVAADSLGRKDTCNGDSGGPLFARDSEGREFLAAATSRAIRTAPGSPNCGPGGIYVRLDGKEQAWLKQQGIALTTQP